LGGEEKLVNDNFKEKMEKLIKRRQTTSLKDTFLQTPRPSK